MVEKNTATKTPAKIDTSNWESEQIGFDPYIKIVAGMSVVATLLGLDARNKKFQRYQMMASETMECQRGPGDDADERHEKVTVHPGETFNMSVFYSLEEPFNRFLQYSEDTGKMVQFQLVCTGSTKTTEGNDVWLWKCNLPPATKKALTEWKRAHNPNKALRAAAEETRPALES